MQRSQVHWPSPRTESPSQFPAAANPAPLTLRYAPVCALPGKPSAVVERTQTPAMMYWPTERLTFSTPLEPGRNCTPYCPAAEAEASPAFVPPKGSATPEQASASLLAG